MTSLLKNLVRKLYHRETKRQTDSSDPLDCITIISRYNPWKGGGLETVVKTQINSVKILGLKSHVIFREREEKFPTVLSDLLHAFHIYAKAARSNCRIILDNLAFTFLYGLFIHNNDLRSNRKVIRVHHGTPNYLDSYSGFKLVLSKLYKILVLAPVCFISSRVADINVAVSSKVKRELINYYKVPPEKIVVIPNGVDISRFKPRDKRYARKILRLPLNRKIILFVGGDLDRKNFWLALRVVKAVKRNIPNLLFIVVTSKKNEAKLKKLKNSWLLVLSDVPSNKMPYLYNASDVLLLPSKYEGMPLTLLEALASGCPAVVSPHSAEEEYNGEGYLIARSFSEYIEYVKKILIDEKYRKMLSQRGRKLAVSRYNIRKQQELYRKLILKIIKNIGEP